MKMFRALFFFACAVTTLARAEDWREQRTQFQEKGYIWIKNFFSPQQVMLLQDWAEEIDTASRSILKVTTDTLPRSIPGTLIIVREASDPHLACRAEDMLSCYPDFHHFVAGTISAYVSKLLGEPYVLFKDKINFKWPGGGAFLPHQDFPAYEPFGPREHVTAMVCIDPATLENGCLQVARDWRATFKNDPALNAEELAAGRSTLPYIQGGKNHGSIQPTYANKIDWLPLEASPGDLILISSFVPHYSEPNKSKKPRRAMFLTHNRLREGDHRLAYYHAKRHDPDNPVFHFATPTKARGK
jgi:ectoine hydroxylase-related dioxygenase (phytanoyl-CoA dioxygenase family)